MGVRDLEALDRAHVLHPATDLAAHAHSGPLVIDRGEGVYIYDTRGQRYLEGMAGLWCTALGYGEEALVEAAATQMRKLAFSQMFASRSHEPGIALAAKLNQWLPPGSTGGDGWKLFFGASGSDANDTQVKLARYYNNAIGRPRKKRIISHHHGYHGVTLAAASLTGLPSFHAGFDLPGIDVVFADCPHRYRHGLPGEGDEEFAARLARQLEALIVRENPDTIAAMIVEPVLGAGGVIVPPPTYYREIQQVLDRHSILMIDDEVICGFGRLGTRFGAEKMGLRPDTVSMAKALSSAYVPISAVAIPEWMHEAMCGVSGELGPFAHGYTYSGHPVGAAVALRTLELYEERNIAGHVDTVIPQFQRRLRALAGRAHVGDVRGVGLIGGIELVRDADSGARFDAADKAAQSLAAKVQAHGVIVRALPGDTVAICPPLIISPDQIDELFDGVERGLQDFAAGV